MAVESLFRLYEDWQVMTLHAAASLGGGDILTGPFGSELHKADYVAQGIPTVMPSNIGDNRIVEDGIARITPEDVARLSRYVLRNGDIIYSRRGDVERRALIRDREDGWLCGTGSMRIRFGIGHVDPQYASYYLGHPAVRGWIVRHAIGATMPNLSKSILGALPFVLPPLSTQRRIAHTLGALDDTIDLNHQINQTLDAIARTLFKSWFIDFDPVRAKAEGRNPNLPDHLAALFPSAFTDSELGSIPAGWRVATVGEAVDAVGGSTPSTADQAYWEDGEFCFATPKDMSGLASPVLLDTERKVTQKGIATIGSGLLPSGTLLMSSRAPIGYLAIARVPVCINQGIIAIRCRAPYSPEYMLHWCRANLSRIEANSGGTTFAEISKRNFRPIPFLVPEQALVEQFGQTAGALYDQIGANEEQAHTLAALRDTLLPRLLSGQLHIPAAQDEVEDALHLRPSRANTPLSIPAFDVNHPLPVMP